MQHMQFQVFIFIALVINDLINGQAFTLSPIVGTMDISTCGTVYSTNTTDSQRTESYSFTSTLFYENITFTTCGSAFDTTLRLYKFETGVWTDKKSADDGGSCDPQEELMVSDLDPGDYVLELSSFNLNYFGFYTITTQNCILGTVTSDAPTTTAPTTTTPTAPTAPTAPTTTVPTPTTATSSSTTPHTIDNDAASGDNSESGVSFDLLIQVCIGLAVYAIIPCIFYCVKNTCCNEKK
eukprot:30897_1